MEKNPARKSSDKTADLYHSLLLWFYKCMVKWQYHTGHTKIFPVRLSIKTYLISKHLLWRKMHARKHHSSFMKDISILTGATILPVCPTCKSLGTKPASTAAREAPTSWKKIFPVFSFKILASQIYITIKAHVCYWEVPHSKGTYFETSLLRALIVILLYTTGWNFQILSANALHKQQEILTPSTKGPYI